MSKKTSDIWQYCTVVDKVYAKCNICKQTLSYKSSITNIKRHLARKHPEVCQYQVSETIEIKPIRSDSETTTYEICDENPQPNDNKAVTTESNIINTCGTFHIIPKEGTEIEIDESGQKTTEIPLVRPRKEVKKQRTSDIWQHCTVIDKVYAKCNICEAVLSYKTSITNIKKHLARKHMFVYPSPSTNNNKLKGRTIVVYEKDLDDDQASTSQMQVDDTQTKQPPFEQDPPSFLHTYSRKRDPASLTLKNKLDSKLLDVFIKDYQSFKIVEEIGFRSFVRSLNSSYVIPSKQQIVKSLSAAYGKCLMDMKEHAQEIKECCLTTECWTSSSSESFITVTVHFINENFAMKSIMLECLPVHATTNISKEFQRITEEWGVDQKILLAVSDNDVHVETAMADLKWNHFGCFANTLDSLIQDALSELEWLLEKVKCIVFHYRSNTEANSKLEVHQKNADATAKPKKLLQESSTRWNSSLRMLERFIELEDAVKETTVLYQDINLPQLTSAEWTIIHELCVVLKPFETVTKFISSEKYTSASLIIVLTKELDDALQDMLRIDFTTIINEILTKLKTCLFAQLGNIEISETLALCTFLDPRFKNLGFSSAETAEATKDHLVELLTNKIPDQNTIVAPSPAKTDPNEASFSIWQSFKKRVSECKQSGTNKSRAIMEIERYLEDELMDQQKNPLEWWREYKNIYPCMSVIAQEVMCALGTSVPCDRIFSKSGLALNTRRNCLSSEEVKILTFLNTNSALFGKKLFDI